jgi:hypothetical protein
LVLDHYALIERSETHLDPPPLQKWAEEGFAVVQVCRHRWEERKDSTHEDVGNESAMIK